jgi:hypothetical protein
MKDGVELRASEEVIDRILDLTIDTIERAIEHDYKEIYYLEEMIPRELGALIEKLRTLPVIEETEPEEGEGFHCSEGL